MFPSTRSYTADDFTFRVPITFPGEAVDLSGATVEVFAAKTRGPVVAGTIAMSGPAEASGRFDDGALAEGVYRVQVRVTFAGDTQTVAEWQHTVSRSLSGSTA